MCFPFWVKFIHDHGPRNGKLIKQSNPRYGRVFIEKYAPLISWLLSGDESPKLLAAIPKISRIRSYRVVSVFRPCYWFSTTSPQCCNVRGFVTEFGHKTTIYAFMVLERVEAGFPSLSLELGFMRSLFLERIDSINDISWN